MSLPHGRVSPHLLILLHYKGLAFGLTTCKLALLLRYTKHLAELTEKQRFGAPKTSANYTTEQHLERINFEKLRITELNQQIEAVTESRSKHGGLMRMNLARPVLARQQTIPYELSQTAYGGSAGGSREADADTSHTLQLVKAQNKLLTKVSQPLPNSPPHPISKQTVAAAGIRVCNYSARDN